MWIPQKNENSKRTSNHQPQKNPRKKKIDDRVGLCFPKFLRILSRKYYQKINAEGTRLPGKVLFLQYYRNAPPTRLGITVTKKYGKAHDRNYFKRLVRETFREYYDMIPSGIQVNALPRLPRRPINKELILKDLQALVLLLNKE